MLSCDRTTSGNLLMTSSKFYAVLFCDTNLFLNFNGLRIKNSLALIIEFTADYLGAVA
jgi:hypothetical protein